MATTQQALSGDGRQRAHSVAAKGAWVVEPMDYHGVGLDGGTFAAQTREVREYYLAIANDDLLRGFRLRAGLDAPGKDLVGWYSRDRFNIFGQVISGLSRLYAATGDEACRDKVNVLLAEWAKCIAADGYFFYSAKCNAPHYVYDKTVCGLVDAYLYCGNTDALVQLGRITDWAIKNLGRDRRFADNNTEWYTLSENLYRAHLATGDVKYRDFAEVWEYTEYWNLYAAKAKVPQFVHAYSHVNTLCGAAAAYRVKGDARYLDILKNAYDYLQEQATFATGGFGPNEGLITRDAMTARLLDSESSFEVQCGSCAGFKMGKYLIGLTGDARYGDWVEALAINSLGASLPSGPTGRVYYYADYNAYGATKALYPAPWPCCAGTRPQAVADYDDVIYFKDAAGLYVNLFAPSTAKWSVSGASVSVSQVTDFPAAGQTEFIVHTAAPATFTISLRVPGWLAKPMTATLNGKDVPLQTDSLHWARIKATWRDGDRLKVTLPMDFSVSRLTAAESSPRAVLYGPVVLAFNSAAPARQSDLAGFVRGLRRDAKSPLTWTSADMSVIAQPFYAVPADQKYFVYLVAGLGERVGRGKIKFSAGWVNNGIHHISKVAGATADASFEGTNIRWQGYRFDDAGKAEVTIDDKVVGVVDQYAPGRGHPFDCIFRGLSAGKHTIRLRLLEDRNPQSKDRFINVWGFVIEPDEPPATGPVAK